MVIDFLKDRPRQMFEQVLADYTSLNDIDRAEALRLVKTDELFKKLTVKWYDHLLSREMDRAFSVYNDDYYFIDIFQCFKTYSRVYIRQLAKNKIYNEMKSIRSFVDIGCGLSYSTCALKQIFPAAQAYAVNLRGTKQWTFCDAMSKSYDFKLVGDVKEIESDVDLVFASEFYEHLENPIAHVRQVVTSLKPKYMVIANSFNVWAIGHFNEYYFDGRVVDQKEAGREFNKYVRSLGYESIKCGMWNNKPLVWRKI